MKLESVSAKHIGLTLSNARIRQGMTLSDVAFSTKVPTRYLIAIERETFSDLPSRVHTIGFSRAFAKCVRLDAETIVEAIKVRFDEEDPSKMLQADDGPKVLSRRKRLSKFINAAKMMLAS